MRPERDVYAADRPGWRWLTHSRRFTATGAGTQVDEQVDWATRCPGCSAAVDQVVLRRRILRAHAGHLDAYAAAAAGRALDVVQVVGAAHGRRAIACSSRSASGGPYDGRWEFPGGKVEPGESRALRPWCARSGRSSASGSCPQEFLGEVVLDGVVGGGPSGSSTLRVWSVPARPGEPPRLASTPNCAGWRAADLDTLDWIAADRPLLPAVLPHLR